MSRNPLFLVCLGLSLVLAPAVVQQVESAAPGVRDSMPSRLATVGAEESACDQATVDIAGGRQLGCQGAKPVRRQDRSGAVFIRVQE